MTSNKKKSSLIGARVTAAQQRFIRRAAAEQNKTTSQYVRDQTLTTSKPKKGLLASLFSGGK